MLIIPPFTMMLGSDGGDKAPDDPRQAEVLNWSIDITANSDPNVPEPSTWVMMLLGFAGLGYAGYWSRPRGSSLAPGFALRDVGHHPPS
jgi:hypothetical protein